jgi:hypothetical protein
MASASLGPTPGQLLQLETVRQIDAHFGRHVDLLGERAFIKV